MRTQLGQGSLLGWRVRQCTDLGASALLAELGERVEQGLATDATALAAIQAAIQLTREERVAVALANITGACTPTGLKDLVANSAGPQVARLLDLLSTVDQLLDGPVADTARETLDQLCALIVAKINRLKKAAAESDEHTDEQKLLATQAETALVQMIDFAPSLLRALIARDAPVATLSRAKGAVRAILTAVAGNELHRLLLLGGNAERVVVTLEAIALVADDPRRPNLAISAVSLFEEMTYTRLYITGAVAQQPNWTGHDLVRPFGAVHIDGVCRTCTTLAWMRALVAMRPILAKENRAHEVDHLIERITYNALMVAVGTDPTRWFGPIPHGVDRNEEFDLFCSTRNGHRFAPGPWRPNMRSGGTEEQCCAASSLLGFALVTELAIDQSPDQKTIFVNQLGPGETVGDGWELSITGSWPYEGDLNFSLRSDHPVTLQVRIPDWHQPQDSDEQQPRVRLFECPAGVTSHTLDIPPTPRLLVAHPLVSDARGCVAMTAGPFVYCLEGADQMGNLQPRQVRFDADGAITLRRELEHPEAYPTVHATGEWRTKDTWQDFSGNGKLGYRWWRAEPMDLPVDITFVPFYTVANRGLWEMTIWIPLATPSE
jgi:Beta-L-arabinofuranosidase, GH127